MGFFTEIFHFRSLRMAHLYKCPRRPLETRAIQSAPHRLLSHKKHGQPTPFLNDRGQEIVGMPDHDTERSRVEVPIGPRRLPLGPWVQT